MLHSFKVWLKLKRNGRARYWGFASAYINNEHWLGYSGQALLVWSWWGWEDGVWVCGAGIAKEYPPRPKAEPRSGRGVRAAVEGGRGLRFRLSDACGKAVGCGVEDYRGRFCVRHSRMVQPNRRLKSTLR